MLSWSKTSCFEFWQNPNPRRDCVRDVHTGVEALVQMLGLSRDGDHPLFTFHT